MITRIELANFMSHAHTVIEPAAGLTVLVGANNVGKSAVVAALQILCSNEGSTHVIRHGAKQCSVKVETDDGHVIEWRRKSSPSYVIDGQAYDRLKQSGLPDELHRTLRLPKVADSGGEDFDIHFGVQKSPIFLLGSSPASKARFFASSSDANRLVAMQQRHKEKLSEAQREKARLEAESQQVNAELELLEPAVELESRLERIVEDHAALAEREQQVEQMSQRAAALAAEAVALRRLAERAESLAGLSSPPALSAVEPIEQMIAAYIETEAESRRLLAQSAVFERLPAPPEQADTEELSRWLAEIEIVARDARAGELKGQALAALATPPDQVDVRPLNALLSEIEACRDRLRPAAEIQKALQGVEPPPPLAGTELLRDLLGQLESAGQAADQCQRELLETAAELSAANEALRSAAAERSCPQCGAPLDPDRVVARAAAGWKGDGCE